MKKWIEETEQLIRNGQFDVVEERLQKLGKVERQEAVAIANIARRIHRPHLSIKVLQPIVRPENKLQKPPTELEKIEYAEALRRVGAVQEAWDLLNEVNETQFPQTLIFKIYCLFNQWKYEEALPLLRKYVAVESLNPYERAVGQINLAAALVTLQRLEEASQLLQVLQDESKKAGFLMLYGNSLELSAQVLIFQKDYQRALHVLEEANEFLKGAGYMANLFVQKWSAIAKSLLQNQATAELRDVLERAKQEKHWETVRDCDLYIAQLDQDSSRFEHLFFGTPYESYRTRILRFAGTGFKTPETYLWSASETPDSVFNLATGQVTGKCKAELVLGQALHRFFILLSQDFYRPVPVLSAFGNLFPDEFMAETSAGRVHQIISRCRKWIEESGLDLEIEEVDGAYRLSLGAEIGLLVPAEPLPLAGEQLEWLYLKTHLDRESFNINEAIEALSWSRSSTRRLLQWATSQGYLEKQGKGTATTYSFVDSRES